MSIIIPDGLDEAALMEMEWKGDGVEEVCSQGLFFYNFVSVFSKI
ncbi:hypothetical protein [Paenibacillus taichungensis]